MASPPGGKEFPFILPAGKDMKIEEFLAHRYKYNDLSEDKDEIIPPNLTRKCLNETHVERGVKEIINSDPEAVVRSILENVLRIIRKKNSTEVGYYEALSLSYDAEVQKAFDESYILRFVDLKKLKTTEQTTCFLINLTNLMWIHGLFSFSEGFHRGLFFKNWCLRHVCYNVIGYRVGSSIKFLSLYDLHSTLLNYPPILRTNTLNQFTFLEDARLHSVIGQPYIYSPKIQALNPETLEKDLSEFHNEYLKSYIIVNSDIDLLVPVPLMMHMERTVYDPKIESELVNSTDSIPEKCSPLVDVLKERGFPYYDLLTKDVYMMTDTQFKIKFDYDNNFDIENVSEIRRVVWKCCRFHKSLYNCLQHHASLVRSTLMDDHLPIDSLCRCDDKNVICINNVLYKMSQMYSPMLNSYKIEIDFENKGLRCLYAAVSFAVGFKTKPQLVDLAKDADDEFLLMLQIIESLYVRVSTELICNKIRICVKIFLIANDVYERWPKWYSVFIGDPSEILSFLVDRDNFRLADEWISVVYAIEPGFTFELEEFSKYISFLSDLEDVTHLKKALTLVNGLQIVDICDYIVKNFFSLTKLTNLVSTVIYSNLLNATDEKRYYGLLVGLKMISAIPQCEQPLYFDVAFSPVLVVEQMILNKKLPSLKPVLDVGTKFIATLPQEIQRLETISRDQMDGTFKEYASKALHFRKKPAATDCLNAALLHAEIFKDGNFYPPDEVPATNKWIPNNWVPKCMCCRKTEFSVFVRRHHCRRCGRVVCDSCSTKRMKVVTYKGFVRVCDQCFDFEAQYENMDDSVSENSTATDDSYKKTCWKLSSDNDMNTLIRQQAAFDSAPDIELCLSILELHSESIAVPRMLFSNAESLIKILRQRLVCPANFDYSEISNIAKSLLLAAKIYYTHLGEMQSCRKCEELDSEVDILNHLSKIKFFSTDQSRPLRDIQELKKVRDTLLEKQKWELALEISTKIGVECHSIWYLWGLTLIKSGEYAAARNKISRSNIKKNPALVKEILGVLSNNAEKDSSRSFTDLFKLGSTKPTPTLPNSIMDECVHYLTSYGTSQLQFDFYTKYERLYDAIRVTLDKKISPKEFVEKVFAPCMRQNDYVTVLTSMKRLNDSLKEWDDYINEICIYCKKNDLFNELYEIQKWSKDYYRAAISCTQFYTKGATTYAQLGKKEEHLRLAICHLKLSMGQAEGKKLDMVTKQLTCLRMQLEVTEMIASNNATANLKFTEVPTLLGKEESKLIIIALIFESQKDFKVAFNYTERMIAEFSLNVVRVYTKLTETFMHKNQENNVITMVELMQELKLDRDEVINVIACTALKKDADPETFLKFITSLPLKIEMALAVNRLKTAFLTAITLNKLEYFEKVLVECKKQNATSLIRIVSSKVDKMRASSQNS
ncbi:zinc finger FYVE domain-containing protein 26 isoform X2 [Planococcus citri]|uniref:zinc finger FYVE domain-containing protein 26 isoform X2 n=1 Tax=Planococcus citri TaxID=170843 RepID=UPI0031F99183